MKYRSARFAAPVILALTAFAVSTETSRSSEPSPVTVTMSGAGGGGSFVRPQPAVASSAPASTVKETIRKDERQSIEQREMGEEPRGAHARRRVMRAR